MRIDYLTHRGPPAHYTAEERARFFGQCGPTLCERVAQGGVRHAFDEARARLRRGEIEEALVWIERTDPRLDGLAKALARAGSISFGPPASLSAFVINIAKAADAFAVRDLPETIAQIEALPGFHGLSRQLAARIGA